MFLACLEGLHDRRAAACLNGKHLGALAADPAQLLEFVEGLPHADQPGPAAGGIEDRPGQAPAQLGGKLEAHRLLTLDPVRFLQRRKIEPQPLGRALPHDCAAFVDQPVDAVDPRALRRDLADVDLGRIGGTQHDRLDPSSRRIGCQRGPCIAVGRHGDARHTQFLRHGYCHDEPTRLEAPGGQASLVLDQHIRPARNGYRHKRSLNFAESDDAFSMPYRQQFAPAPQVGGPRLQGIF